MDGDTLLDLATCGLLQDYLGRQRRRWRGFADEAHTLKARWGREYAAFCGENGIVQATQVVVRAPISVIPLTTLRAVHTQDSARLGERLRYGRQRIAPGLACDLVSAEVISAAPGGTEVDLHFHLAVRGTVEDCRLMKRYIEASGWSWWDSLTGGSEQMARYPGALAQYESKSLAETIRKANEGGADFSPANLAELFRQTRRVALTRATGAFRIWKGELAQSGLEVVEGDGGRLSFRKCKSQSALARRHDKLFTSSGARLLRLTLHDFGNGVLRPAIRVRGREGISFSEVAEAYELMDAVQAARQALSQGNTANPESPCPRTWRTPLERSLPPSSEPEAIPNRGEDTVVSRRLTSDAEPRKDNPCPDECGHDGQVSRKDFLSEHIGFSRQQPASLFGKGCPE